MTNKDLWCDNHSIDENGEIICLAHLAEARVLRCPYESNQDRLTQEYPCSDYEPIRKKEASSAIIMDGKALARKIKSQVRKEVEALSFQPKLSVILVGDNPASQVYVRNKSKDCVECDIGVENYFLSEDTSESKLIDLIHRLNKDDTVSGILVQMPLPKHINSQNVIDQIDWEKDVDCFHPHNAGRLFIGNPIFAPCTPAGVIELLKEYDIVIEGKRCVVLGRSNIVGKPMSALLLQENGTVTTCHSKTTDLKSITREADILISAIGKRNSVTADMVKEGSVVIDVAINRTDDGKLCGDVDFEEVSKKVSYITPVPGGVGPMTRAMLMKNVLRAATLG